MLFIWELGGELPKRTKTTFYVLLWTGLKNWTNIDTFNFKMVVKNIFVIWKWQIFSFGEGFKDSLSTKKVIEHIKLERKAGLNQTNKWINSNKICIEKSRLK